MKKISESKKMLVMMVFVFAGLFLFQVSLMAEGPILSRTGVLQVTNPDGTVLVINPTDPLAGIVSGSMVALTSGSAEIAPTEGFIQLVVGGSVATIKAGDKVTVSIDPVTGKVDFNVQTGQIAIVSGNTTTTIGAGQRALLTLDKVAGIATVESLAGDIETVTVGVKTTVPKGSSSQTSADPATRNVHVESVQGSITVAGVDGAVTTLNTGEVLDTPGSAEGEIQTFDEGIEATIPRVEERRQPILEGKRIPEPSQPSVPEGSPFGGVTSVQGPA